MGEEGEGKANNAQAEVQCCLHRKELQQPCTTLHAILHCKKLAFMSEENATTVPVFTGSNSRALQVVWAGLIHQNIRISICQAGKSLIGLLGDGRLHLYVPSWDLISPRHVYSE